ncbi:MauE/DoxX family redox-associated membrane protein [Micromonospora sp. DT53]|uniref:MauE/DoxX family redox-associated membrane protein n=1 Tax=Micromonospora sp. DT53 TaxID=3393444 RepID=UPI003CF81ED5
MDHLVDFGRTFLGLAFIFSVVEKVRGPTAFRAFRDAVVSLAPPLRGVATPTAVLIVVAETTSVLTLALPATAPVGFTLSIALMVAFTIALILALRRRAAVSCGCFGDSGSAIAPRHVGRNAVLLLAAVAGLFRWAAGDTAGVGRPSAGLVLAAGLAAILALATATLDDIAALFANGRS